jgi:ribosomal subunit interface protein
MIKLEIETDDYELSDDLRSRIEMKIGGLDEYMDTLEEGHVTISWEGGSGKQTKVRAQVWGKEHKFDGSDTDWKAVTAIGQTSHKLETRIRREHSKDLRSHDRHR